MDVLETRQDNVIMEDTEEEEVCVRNHDVEEITLSKRASSTARSFCRFCRF